MPDRCFAALALTPPMLEALTSATNALRNEMPGWRDEKWVAPALFHVTVAFFGRIEDERYTEVEARFRSIAADTSPPSLCLTGASAVPSISRASMLWAQIEGHGSHLARLRDGLLAGAGCEMRARPFRPHVTLVRARRPRVADPTALAAADRLLSATGKDPDGSVSVPSLTVFSSTLGPKGPRYDRLADLPFRGLGDW